MKQIHAALPALGNITIDFRNESFDVLCLMGEKELARLRKVAHLGIVSSVFTGVNHSREEYMLLQCAIIGLISKLHKGDSGLAVSADIRLDGLENPVSSGEELLKCWSLLGNYGHCKFTYTTERGWLYAAQSNSEIFRLITQCKRIPDLQRWARTVIRCNRESDLHWLLCLARLESFRGQRFQNIIRNLVLPIDSLFVTDSRARLKLLRMRTLYERVRLLCMTTLDSFYSPQPISLQLSSALLGLRDLIPSAGESNSFDEFLNRTNGWLAERLYLHPKAVAVRGAYERKVKGRILDRFAKSPNSAHFRRILSDVHETGVGKPTINKLPLLRLKFTDSEFFETKDPFELSVKLYEQIGRRGKISVAASKNPFNSDLYLDLSSGEQCDVNEIAASFGRTCRWLMDALNRVVERRFESLLPSSIRSVMNAEALEDFRTSLSNREIRKNLTNVQRLFDSYIRTMLPENLMGTILDFRPEDRLQLPILVKIARKGRIVYDDIAPRMEQKLSGATLAQRNEFLAINRVLGTIVGDLTIVCPEKFVIQDCHRDNRHIDEWDGIVIAISKHETSLTIIEAKSGGGQKQRVDRAFVQLKSTLDNHLRRFPTVSYRRRRLPPFGATLRVSIPHF